MEMSRHRWETAVFMSMCKCAAVAVLLAMLSADAFAQTLRTGDGLAGRADAITLSDISVGSSRLPSLAVEAAMIDPRTGRAAVGFAIEGKWTAAEHGLRLDGEVRAPGQEDTVADLVILVRGATLPQGSIEKDPLLLPAKLLSKLPLVSLRVGGDDHLGLAVPPDHLGVFRFSETRTGVELRFPFGFTKNANPRLQMRAPFACVLYRTEPKWHFRSTLEGYYSLFPEPFEPFIRKAGGWFFAAETKDLPNPQHFYYHEGGPAEWKDDDERGLGTYPYQESSSWTIALPGNRVPKSYAEAMASFAELEKQVSPKAWAPQSTLALDSAVKRSGKRSILADSGATGTWTGARQSVLLKRPTKEPIAIRGFSKAEGVSGGRDSNYAIYVDVCYASGGFLFGQCATFPTGTHDWQESELVLHPAEPVSELRVYCLLRNHQGKAWFDDIHIGPVKDPSVNWIINPGFEEDEKRSDLQFVRNNVCENSQGEYVVAITDNLSADVGPDQPMNLLRFTLNVDPNLPDSPQKPNVAGRQFEYYDGVFRDSPSVDGCYIDSVSAWCYGVLNCRRDQWMANEQAFGYDPSNFRVGAHGRFAMTTFLRALQQRYHPQGKAIFTNIHVNLDAFPLYLVSDVPGIESSLFQDPDSTFFYRASAYKKPVLLMDFMNLHGLDKREVAERFHQNAAQWGELPSTGRFVQEAYRLYGDLTHAWMPAIQELAEAGWEPVPLATGAHVERFPGKRSVYFTIRASRTGTMPLVRIEPKAIKDLGEDLLAMDGVTLRSLELRRDGEAWALQLQRGGGPVTVVMIGAPDEIRRWLLKRAFYHVAAAARVRGNFSKTPEVVAVGRDLREAMQADRKSLLKAVSETQRALATALRGMPDSSTDLFALSTRRELQQAQEALSALEHLPN
jgi:hypothetical protein